MEWVDCVGVAGSLQQLTTEAWSSYNSRAQADKFVALAQQGGPGPGPAAALAASVPASVRAATPAVLTSAIAQYRRERAVGASSALSPEVGHTEHVTEADATATAACTVVESAVVITVRRCFGRSEEVRSVFAH